jgi:hypothetical protein
MDKASQMISPALAKSEKVTSEIKMLAFKNMQAYRDARKTKYCRHGRCGILCQIYPANLIAAKKAKDADV